MFFYNKNYILDRVILMNVIFFFLGSIPSFGSPFGSIISGLTIDKYGRKFSLVISIIPTIIGWVLMCLNFGITTIFIGRFLTGMISGSLLVGQVYTAECVIVNHYHLRNSFTMWEPLSAAFGILLTYILGSLLPYENVAYITTIVTIFSLLGILLFIPESPHWLFNRGLIKKAKISEKRLNIRQPILQDLNIILSEDFNLKSCLQSIKTGIRKLRRKDVYKPLFIMTTWCTSVMYTGGAALNAYMVDIISTSSHENILSDYTEYRNVSFRYDLSIISGVLILLAVILASSFVTYVGIKKLFFFSSFNAFIGLVALTFSLSYQSLDKNQNVLNMIHVISIWLITFFYSFGVITVPCSILGEMFPYDAKGFASIPVMGLCFSAAVAIKLHLYLCSYFGAFTYILYAFVNLANVIFVYFLVPETVGKTLEEIGERFLK